MARLSVEDLVVAYGSVTAVRNVSFTVEDGEFVPSRAQRMRQDDHVALYRGP